MLPQCLFVPFAHLIEFARDSSKYLYRAFVVALREVTNRLCNLLGQPEQGVALNQNPWAHSSGESENCVVALICQ